MLQRLLSDAKKLKENYSKKLEEFETEEFEYTHGKNHVFVKANGKYEILELKIADELFGEKEMLQELVSEAITELIKQIEKNKKNIEQSMMPKDFI